MVLRVVAGCGCVIERTASVQATVHCEELAGIRHRYDGNYKNPNEQERHADSH